MNRTKKSPTQSMDCPDDGTFLAVRDAGFRRVLEFERDCATLLEYASDAGQPYWAMVRWYLCRVIQDRMHGTQGRATGLRSAVGVGVIAPFVFRSFRDIVRLSLDRPREIVFVCSGVANIRVGCRYVNRLTDLMARCFPDQTMLLEKHDALRYHRPRAYPQVRAYGGLQLMELVFGRFGVAGSEQKRQIQAFFALLRSSFDDLVSDEEWAWLERICSGKIRAERGALRVYGCLLDRLRPRVLLIEDGHYGASGHLLAAARRRGIPVAEYQHGLISVNHEAYNYHPTLLARGFSQFLPDHLLTYGDYWSEVTSTSARLSAMGNPHLDASIRSMRAQPSPVGSLIFLSAAMDPARYREVLQQLVECGYRVTFRPHPCERNNVEVAYGSFCTERGIAIDVSSDLYGAIARHQFVVGDISTAVVEAAALQKPVFLIDSPLANNHMPVVFPRFRHAREIAHLLTSAPGEGGRAMGLWADDWEQRYRSWLQYVTSLNLHPRTIGEDPR